MRNVTLQRKILPQSDPLFKITDSSHGLSTIGELLVSHVTASETQIIFSAAERVTKLFQGYFSDIELVGKYSRAAIILSNYFEIILFHM